MHMAPCQSLLALAALLPALAAAQVTNDGLMKAFNDLPQCGLTCFASTVGQSRCNPLDFVCMCGDEPFLDAASQCVLEKCTTVQSLEVTRSLSDACGLPRRNKKKKLLLPLIAEIPAAFCPWLRLWTNWKLQSKIAIDDYLMTVAGLLYLVFLGLGAWVGQFAFGEDIWYVEPEVVVKGLKYFYIDEPFYLVCLCLTKVTVVCFYLRIFTTRSFRVLAYLTLAFIIIPTIAILFLQIFQCRPVHLVWDGWLTQDWWEDKCLNLTVLAYVAGALSAAQELVLIILPMPWLLQLKISLKTKIGVVFMFSLGIFVLATSCTRLSLIVAFGHTRNPTWDYVDPLIWSGLEVAVSVIVACCPALRLLILHWMPSIRSTKASNERGTGKGSGYGKLGFSSRSTGSRARVATGGAAQLKSGGGGSTGNESQVELGVHPFDNSYEDNGYRCKTPTEVKVAAVDNTYEMTNRTVPARGIMVHNELVVASEISDRGPSPYGRLA